MYRRTNKHAHNILEYEINGGMNKFILPKCTIVSMYLTENTIHNLNLGGTVAVSFKTENEKIYQIKTLKLNSVNFKFNGGLIYIRLPETKIYGKFFCTV